MNGFVTKVRYPLVSVGIGPLKAHTYAAGTTDELAFNTGVQVEI